MKSLLSISVTSKKFKKLKLLNSKENIIKYTALKKLNLLEIKHMSFINSFRK